MSMPETILATATSIASISVPSEMTPMTLNAAAVATTPTMTIMTPPLLPPPPVPSIQQLPSSPAKIGVNFNSVGPLIAPMIQSTAPATAPSRGGKNLQMMSSAPTSAPTQPITTTTTATTPSTSTNASPVVSGVVEKEKEKIETTTTITTPTISVGKAKVLPKPPDEFLKDLCQFHERRGTPITSIPKINGEVVDLYKLYTEVTERGGFNKVNMRDEWDEIHSSLESLLERCVNSTAAIKYIYRRYLDKYERLNFFGEDPDKLEALEAAIENAEIGSGRSRMRYSSMAGLFGGHSSVLTQVPMSYNYRQHIVNMDRRRQFKMSQNLYKGSTYEKLQLSLLSPLPNEQDFAINACTLMTNEAKHTLRLSECPHLVDVLLAHLGVYSDYTMHKLFDHVYTNIRRQSQYSFWRDLLRDKKSILELYTDEGEWKNNNLVGRESVKDVYNNDEDEVRLALLEDCDTMDFLHLKRGDGTHDYIGQRALQIVQIFRNLSFFDENLNVLAKNRTLWRFLCMAANIRWSNIHIQTLETAGNIATEFELLDPTTDKLSRNLMATLCDGIDSMDRGVIINCLEILYKICSREGNEPYIYKCLSPNLYQRLCMLLSLNDVMLLIFALECLYALTSLGARACSHFIQVRGIVDQLVSLITVEAQSYGPEGCILMRVVEIVPGNMLPMVAQNIANLQNVAVIKQQQQQQQQQQQPLQQQQQPQQQQPILNVIPQQTVLIQQQHQQQVAEILQQQQQQLDQLPQQQQPLMLPQPSLPQVIIPPHIQNAPPSTTPMNQTITQDDEQFALAWLGATFERAATNDHHVEQQELYRMYLAHCQKTGKHSVVNHMQFPRLVRLIFNASVGPVMICRTDGTELPSLHYVSLRLRTQPLCGISKPPVNIVVPGPCSPKLEAARKKKKLKPEGPIQATMPPTPMEVDIEQSKPTSVASVVIAVSSAASIVSSSSSSLPQTSLVAPTTSLPQVINVTTTAPISSTAAVVAEEQQIKSVETSEVITNPIVQPQLQLIQQQTVANPQQQQQQHSTSSLIKSLLANKVNQRQQKQKELTTAAQQQLQQSTLSTVPALTPTTQSSSCPPPPPPPQLQLQTSNSNNLQQQQAPIKVPSNAISALVNNTLMHHTPVKVGQTTIKPLNSHMSLEKKQIISESVPPPLAPLSGTSNVVTKDASGRTVIIANQSLVDLPNTIIKRKLTIDENMDNIKRVVLDSNSSAIGIATKDETPAIPSKNAANLYAEMAASILEDEDLDDIPPLSVSTNSQINSETQQQQLFQVQLQGTQTTANSLAGVQRQIVFQTNVQGQPTGAAQLKLSAPSVSTQQIPTAMATIKGEQCLQAMPIILQSKTIDQQGQPTQILQQVIQGTPQPQQQQTQYMLATNNQGQTYLVAQQPQVPAPPTTQTVLVTQAPHQLPVAGGVTKTIFILQQQNGPVAQQQQIITGPALGSGQKMIMTTSQGQQVLLTQRPSTPQQQSQIIINPQTGTATHIHTTGGGGGIPVTAGTAVVPVQNASATTIIQRGQQVITQQPNTAQISPSLLSQLNQIPATIKLHQPAQTSQMAPQPPQQATISRIGGKTMPALQIPQLQQHQSIIQQHIISGPNEKRQVLLGGGRAIEIKETLITQTPPSVQQSQLNSQTIITTQPAVQQVPAVLQQQQHHIRAVLEHQQHPSIIQQKITMPIGNNNNGQSGQQHQVINEMPSLVHTTTQQIISRPIATPTPPPLPPPSTSTLPNQQPQLKPATTLMAAPAKKIQEMVAKPTMQVTSSVMVTTNSNVTTVTSAESSSLISKDTTTTAVAAIAKVDEKPNAAPTSVSTSVSNPIVTSSNGATSTCQPPTITTTSSSLATTAQTPIPTPPTQPTAVATTSLQAIGSHSTNQPIAQSVPLDVNWLFICDWRNCPRRKFKSLSELQHHVCTTHCPDHLDMTAEIFCQWGTGAGLCDNIARKRFSLMTHLIDRHLSLDSLRAGVNRRIATGMHNVAPTQPVVTIVRNVDHSQRANNASPSFNSSVSTSSSSSLNNTNSSSQPQQPHLAGSSALQAIKRHSADFINPKELMDENEGPVTKSIRLTSALILRNLVTYTSTAKRNLRHYEIHLANVASSNVEASGVLAQILHELNN